MTWRLVLRPSTFLISAAAAAFTILNPNHPCSQLIAAGHPEKLFNGVGAVGLNIINTIQTPGINEPPVQQPVDQQFNQHQARSNASLCFTTAVQDGFDVLSNLLEGLQQGQ
jgi:hypothetical protein